jgi:hypothetical protein
VLGVIALLLDPVSCFISSSRLLRIPKRLSNSILITTDTNEAVNGDTEKNGQLLPVESLIQSTTDTTGIGRKVSDRKDDNTTPVCLVVTRCDAKLPPLQNFRDEFLLSKLDSIYACISHDEIRRLEKNQSKVVQVTRASLEDAGFVALSRRDLDLCEALNAGYLQRLSILPDTSGSDPNICKEFYPERFDENGHPYEPDELLFGGHVMVFWRGYDRELSRGRLLLSKIDYLQASIVQRSASWAKRQLDAFEESLIKNIMAVYRRTRHGFLQVIRNGLELLPNAQIRRRLEHKLNANCLSTNSTALVPPPGKLFKLARYGGSRIFVGSADPTDALTPFLMCEQEFRSSPEEEDGDLCLQSLNGELPRRNSNRDTYEGLNYDTLIQCPYDAEASKRLNTTLPTMQLLKRVALSSLLDFFSASGRRLLLKTIFSKSELEEPTYEEVVVIWRPLPKKTKLSNLVLPKVFYEVADMFDIAGLPERPKLPEEEEPRSLEIRAFSSVPMANLQAVLPKTKLVFRPADAFVFDFVSIISLALVIGSQRYDSARLDLLALLSVVLWSIRTVLRYSNKLARYDLLVKKFLTSKISQRNVGALKYIVNEAGSQRARRAALVHSWLCNLDLEWPMGRDELVALGTPPMNDFIHCVNHIPVDIVATLNDLEHLNLLKSTRDGRHVLVKDQEKAHSALKQSWIDMFNGEVDLNALVGRRKRRRE